MQLSEVVERLETLARREELEASNKANHPVFDGPGIDHAANVAALRFAIHALDEKATEAFDERNTDMITHDHMLEIIRAHRQGIPLQYRDLARNDGWLDCGDNNKGTSDIAIPFDFWTTEYRIKPVPPKLVEGWVTCYGDDTDMQFGLYPSWSAAKEINRSATRIAFVREVNPE